VIATTLRLCEDRYAQRLGSALLLRWKVYQAPVREDLEIYDRVGGGDSFASGLIYGFLSGKDPQWSSRMRCCPRCTGHDYARGHHYGNARGSFAGNEVEDRSYER